MRMSKIISCLAMLSVTVCACSPLQGENVKKVDICVYGGTSAGRHSRLYGPAGREERSADRAGASSGRNEFRRAGIYRYREQIRHPGPGARFLPSAGRHYGKLEQWIFEPKEAEAVFNEYIRRADVEVWYDSRIVRAANRGGVIRNITLENSVSPRSSPRRTVRAKVFIDCSYEGDLMARAGVSYTVGREGNERYGETYNGAQR